MRVRGPVAPKHTVHPITGEAIVPIGVVNGKVIWPVLGGDSSNDDDDDDDSSDDDAGDSGSSGDSGDDDNGDSGSDDGKISREEYDALQKRMQAADKRASEAEKKIKEQEDAKKDDLTKAQDELQEVKGALEEAQSAIRTLRLENAFLKSNKHSWHDPDIALDLADRKGFLEGVTGEDGKIDTVALGKALDRLAKDHAYLVNSEDKKRDPDTPSGQPAGGRSDNSKDEKARKQQLKRRFPTIAR